MARRDSPLEEQLAPRSSPTFPAARSTTSVWPPPVKPASARSRRGCRPGHGVEGACHARRHPPIAGATTMRVTPKLSESKQTRLNKSVRRAEKCRCRARMMRVHGSIRPSCQRNARHRTRQTAQRAARCSAGTWPDCRPGHGVEGARHCAGTAGKTCGRCVQESVSSLMIAWTMPKSSPSLSRAFTRRSAAA